MKAVLLAPEFASSPESDLSDVTRATLKALAADPAVTSLALVVLRDHPEHLAPLGSRLSGKPLQTLAAAGAKAAFARAAWRASSRATRIVCAHAGQLPLAAVALRPGARLALIAHGAELWKRLSPVREVALRRVDRVLCFSQHARERIAARHPARASRLRVLPAPLAEELFDGSAAPAPPPLDHPPVVLHASPLHGDSAHQGAELLLRAFALIPRSAFHHHPELMPRLRFLAAGETGPRLRAMAGQLHLAERVDVLETGHADLAARRRALADCACFVEPCTALGSGAAFLEALALGRPCVGLNAGAAPELIRAELGVLAPPDDPVALAAALAECLSRHWDPAALHNAALEHGPARFAAALAQSWRRHP